MRKRMLHMAGAGAILVSAVMISGSAWALGLGEIQTNTHIGQTLKARIPIVAYDKSNLQGLNVSLASADAYKRAGLNLSHYLFTLNFQVKQSASGPYVLVTSPEPVKLPFLNILVRARWTSGSVTRQYTILLNPPVFVQSQNRVAAPPVQPAQTPPRQASRIVRQPEQEPRPEASQPAAPQPVQRPEAGNAARMLVRNYGPVRHGETLWGIASSLHGAAGVSINQMMVAIYRANPQAFSGNINRLKAGAVLNVPTRRKIANISRRAATSTVQRQHESWVAYKASRQQARFVVSAGPERDSRANAPSAGGEGVEPAPARVAANTPGSAGKIENGGVGEAPGSPPGRSENTAAGAGEVVLTAPRVTPPGNSAALGERPASPDGVGTAASSPHTAAAGAVVAGAGAGLAGQAPDGEGGGTAPNALAHSSSVGGPLKVNNPQLAALAGGEGASAPAAEPPGTPQEEGPADGPAKQAVADSPPTVDSGDRAAGSGNLSAGGVGGIIHEWLSSPKGWIVIALIVILLLLLVFVLWRKRRSRTQWSASERAAGGGASRADALDEETNRSPATGAALAGGVAGAGGAAVAGAADGADARRNGVAPDGAGDDPVAAQDDGSVEQADAELADALVEADFYASNGDHAGAAQSLGLAVQHAPERNDLRLRRLEALFAADDGEGFLSEAHNLHGRVDGESSADWQAAVVMGRQLLPDEALFRSDTPAEAGAADPAGGEGAGELDIEEELDRLTRTEPTPGLQDEFERTLGELSTMIETYMPEDDAIPTELQSSPGEKFKEEESEETAEATASGDSDPGDDDYVLEFEPQEIPEAASDEEEPGAGAREDLSLTDEGSLAGAEDRPGAAPPEEAASVSGDPPDEPFADQLHRTGQRLNLELARSYLEMGNREAARGLLEDIVKGGDEGQRGEAGKLLSELDAGGERETGAASLHAESPAGEGATQLAADGAAQDESASGEAPSADDDYANALDLARAYIEMGDQESARDMLEEVLDRADDTRRAEARELLDTMET